MKLKYVACATLAALTLTACGGGSGDTKAATDPTSAPPAATESAKVNVVYGDVAKNKDLEPIKEGWSQAKMMEGLGQAITGMLKLPADITIAAQECGEENAYWQPDEKTLVMCYELQPWADGVFKDTVETDDQLTEKISNAISGIFFHELGHATVSLYDLPITGKEEDSVDSLATVLLVEGDDTGEKTSALQFAEFWGLLGQQDADFDFADEHSTSGQRYFNITCWVLGSAPDKLADSLVGPAADGLVPEDRAAKCPGDYEQQKNSWLKLLKPHLAD